MFSPSKSVVFSRSFSARSLCSVICPSAQGNLIYAILKLIYLLVIFDAAYGIASVLCVVEMKGFNGNIIFCV